MITDFAEKVKNERVQLEFAANGNVMILESRFNPVTGVKELLPVNETNTQHLDQLIADRAAQIAPLENEIKDLKAVRLAVMEKEKEREEALKEA